MPEINRKTAIKTIKILAAVLLVIFTLAIEYLPGTPSWDDIYAAAGLRTKTIKDFSLSDLTVVYLDVGQGDCEFIYTKDTAILIDTGPYGNAQKIKDLLRDFGLTKINYLIITHQHDDHIGSLPDLEQMVEIENRIIPDENTKMSGITLTLPVDGDEDMTLQFLGPVYKNDSLNNMSLVIKLTYKETSFLFTGDAEADEEGTLLRTYDAEVLRSDVLKVGHHGSDSSSTPAFVSAVAPRYAVISVGADNDYGHPCQSVLTTLQNTEIHRTDLEGTIICTTDGENYCFYNTPVL